MNLRANPESKFLLKYLLVGIACLCFVALSIYDGFVKFPNMLPRAQAWEALEAELETDEKLAKSGWRKRWGDIANENGWSEANLTSEETVGAVTQKIWLQYFFIVVGSLIGVPSLVRYFRTKNSWIETTEDSLRSSFGDEVRISQIEKFDKKKWENKGIGVLHYRSDDGKAKRFIIDDLKYEREPTDAMVCWIESLISPEMIVNGDPEPIPEKISEPSPGDTDSV
ncbi:hypothetical protein CA13_46750 [Planctomycetes bacterium CA13]|uniref:Uncharacterized protein n=1 Tax=Novipirellula herctigrandis TaxID=2527986 RepID=A0A5C5Z7A0_9BACT|nr:hypothetical protein CA13_46750 [Planctomycetes bacterium CA13]